MVRRLCYGVCRTGCKANPQDTGTGDIPALRASLRRAYRAVAQPYPLWPRNAALPTTRRNHGYPCSKQAISFFFCVRITPTSTNGWSRCRSCIFMMLGLVSWLLGIRTPEQVETHPLRGNLFETFIVSELIKSRFNRGERPAFSFWRDSNGNEVDLIR